MQSYNSANLTHYLASLPLLIVLSIVPYVCFIAQQTLNDQTGFFTALWMLGESLVFLQLIYAWYLQWNRLRYPVLYVLCALFFFRMIYFLPDASASPWYIRSNSTLTPALVIVFYLIGIVGLHPSVMSFLRYQSMMVHSYSKMVRVIILSICFIGFTECFWLFQSVHITRDGFDWIERTTQPVWHLYMREPLTIALYRLVYLFGNQWTTLSSHDAIALCTILTGVGGLFFYHQFLRCFTHDCFNVLLGWMLLFSFGGLTVLFFGHIEVYPIFCAFLFLTFYCMQKYLNHEWSIYPAAVAFSLAFVSHVSCGWLLPALFSLSFVKKNNHQWKDGLKFGLIFFLLQSMFWGTLIFWKYDSSISIFLARLHQTFNVGLDRAMFIPPEFWFSAIHLQDWFSVYLYIMPGGVMLLPIVIYLWSKNQTRITWLWFGVFAGYFVYTFCWNADRGYPEDWDLFSPITAVSIPFILKVFFHQYEKELDHSNPFIVCLYLASVGFIPFTLAQIWFHHTQRFISAFIQNSL